MRAWQEDMLTAIEDDSLDRDGIFAHMEVAGRALSFEFAPMGFARPSRPPGRGFSR